MYSFLDRFFFWRDSLQVNNDDHRREALRTYRVIHSVVMYAGSKWSVEDVKPGKEKEK